MASDYIIHSLMLRPDGLSEITYANDTDEREHAALLRTIVFMPEQFPTEVAEVMEDLNALIDEVERYRLSPDEPKERFRPPDGPPLELNGGSAEGSSGDFDAKNF